MTLSNLEQLLLAYSTLSSYQDRGVVSATVHDRRIDVDIQKTVQFATSFVRPNKFRFEYTTPISPRRSLHHLIWRYTLERVMQKWNLDDALPFVTTLNSALASATGLSYGVAHIIPAILMPDEIGPSKLFNLSNLEESKHRQFDYGDHITTISGRSAEAAVIIQTDSRSLVKRFNYTNTAYDSTIKVAIEYEPEVNVDIPDSIFTIERERKGDIESAG